MRDKCATAMPPLIPNKKLTPSDYINLDGRDVLTCKSQKMVGHRPASVPTCADGKRGLLAGTCGLTTPGAS